MNATTATMNNAYNDAAQVAKSLNENYDLFLPPEQLEKMISFSLYFIVGVTLCFLTTYHVLKRCFPTTKPEQIYHYSFEFIAVTKNIFLCVIGTYYYFCALPKFHETTLEDRITGYDHVYIVCAIQFAFNVFSIPVSSMVMGESLDIVVHHVAVLFVSFLSTFFTCGFRYHAPYYYGVIEVTSAPLAMMKIFKMNPEWIQKYPGHYSLVRLAFGVPFLMVRFVWWMPQIIDVLRMTFLVFRTTESSILQLLVGFFFLSSIALTGLQIIWSGIIVKGAMKQKEKQIKSNKINSKKHVD